MSAPRRLKFSLKSHSEFVDTLRKRVNSYFEDGDIAKDGGSQIVVKTIVMFLMYLVPYFFILSGFVTNPYIYIGLWILMGFGGVGIGVNVMHDANHGAFSKNAFWNKVFGKSVNLIGGNATTWKIQHNVLHHAFTNIDGMDHDLEGPKFLRFSPHQERRWYHRFQHIYAWFFYGFQTISRAIVTDFSSAVTFRKLNLIKKRRDYRKLLINITLGRLFYFSYALVLPLIFAPVSIWLVILGFATMQYVTGLFLALIFQSAHVMPDCEFPVATEDGKMENNWAVHQLQTTTNFSPKSRLFSWFIGGLNFQVEHHLFSNISHTHYRKISKIVSETAAEFGVPYYSQKTFLHAVIAHGRMLKRLGTA
ncbi:MAG: fatty acid desaturase [Cryomorphaceae bacterium]